MQLPSIIALQAQGVQCLASNAFVDAMKIFRQCLVELREHVEQRDSVTTSSFSEDRIRVVSVKVQDSLQAIPSPVGVNVYREAFLVTAEHEKETAALTARNLNVITAAVLYNLALAFQLRARSSIQQQSTDLKRSTSLYRAALTSLQALPLRDDSAAPIRIAIGSNLCCVYAETLDFAAMSSCMEWTRHVAAQQMTRYPCATVLFHNLVIAGRMQNQPAPAA